MNSNAFLTVPFSQLMKEKRYDEAREAFEEILEKDPGSKQAHLGIGSICLKQKDYEGALIHFGSARRIDPMMAKAALAVGNIFGNFLSKLDDPYRHWLTFYSFG